MQNVETSIDFDMYYSCDDDGDSAIEFKDFTFRNVSAAGTKYPGSFVCQSSSPCEAITLDTVHHYDDDARTVPTTKKMTCQHAHGTADDVTPESCLKS